jgi:hypothetical protein
LPACNEFNESCLLRHKNGFVQPVLKELRVAAAIHIDQIGEDFSLILKGYLSLVSTRNRLGWKIPYSKGTIVRHNNRIESWVLFLRFIMRALFGLLLLKLDRVDIDLDAKNLGYGKFGCQHF